MKIVFAGDTVSFDLIESPLEAIYQRCIGHLRHIDIPFKPWDNPYYDDDCAEKLKCCADKVGITVDKNLILQKNQEYLNFLHRLYEQSYDGSPDWLDYHEHIHLCEEYNHKHRHLHINYREKAGLLERPFDFKWLDYSTTEVKAGDVFVQWAELGKTPYTYWKNKEPNDINRIRELCKPWLRLRPKVLVAIDDYSYYKSSIEFNQWWQNYHDAWCSHWNIPRWDLKDMKSVIVFGKMTMEQLDKLKKLLQHNQTPLRLLP